MQTDQSDKMLAPFILDVEQCACHIAADLYHAAPVGILSIPELHGVHLLPDPNLPRGAHWNGEEILLSMHIPASDLYEAIPHELVHALACSPRWEHLNLTLRSRDYKRDDFLEAVATRVGERFAERYRRHSAGK